MKLETIKKDKKNNIIIGSMIVLSVVGCLTLTTTRAKYRSVQSLKLASGRVNYKVSDLHIVAIKTSEDGTNYTDQTEIPTSGYILNTEKSKCRIPTSTLTGESAPTDDSIPIEYKEGRVYIGVNKKNTKCYLYFDKYVPTASDILIASFETYNGYKGETSPTFTSVATGSETAANNGIYKVADGMYGGESFYWRGAATTNHVIFDSKCWRIVRINGDRSIRLIYNGGTKNNDGRTCNGNGVNADSVVLSGTAYNSSKTRSYFVGWSYSSSQRPSNVNPQTNGTAAPLKTSLESWYSSNISATAKIKVALGKFCNDRNIGSGWYSADGSEFYYASYTRNYNSSSARPTLSCPDGDVYSLDVGMITADEVTFAGASGVTNNTSYYLYNGKYYWTMSPAYWNGSTSQICFVDSSGSHNTTTVNYTSISVRPVINLRSDVTFNPGSDGTQNNPYIVNTDEAQTSTPK